MPTVAIIDIGLQDGSGLELIREMSPESGSRAIVLGMSGDPDGEKHAIDAGAVGFFPKPVTSLVQFQQSILSHLPSDRQPPGLRLVPDEEISPDPLAYQDDLAHVADVLESSKDPATVAYVAQFLSSVAATANDGVLMQAVKALQLSRSDGIPAAPAVQRLSGLVQERLAETHVTEFM